MAGETKFKAVWLLRVSSVRNFFLNPTKVKMKLTKLSVSALCLGLLMGACNLQEDPGLTPSDEQALALSGKNEQVALLGGEKTRQWRWIKYEMDGKNIPVSSCEMNYVFEYGADGTRTVNIVNSECNKTVSEAQMAYHARWAFYADNDSLLIETSPTHVLKYKVLELSKGVLKLQSQVNIANEAGEVAKTITFEETYIAGA